MAGGNADRFLSGINQTHIFHWKTETWSRGPEGQVLQTGVDKPLREFQTDGAGAVSTVGNKEDIYRDYSSYAVYEPGKTLVTGGGYYNEYGAYGPTRTAVTIDSTSGGPVAASTGSMSSPRKHANLTMLADGTALETGGLSTPELVNLNTGVTAAELWNPATGSWRTLANASVLRRYQLTREGRTRRSSLYSSSPTTTPTASSSRYRRAPTALRLAT